VERGGGTIGGRGRKLDRQSLLAGGLAVASLGGLMACGVAAPKPGPAPERIGSSARVLLAYFSRAGENYYNGGRTNLLVGYTEVLAGIISGQITCDVHRIEAAEPYPDSYDDTVDRNVAEQRGDARPPIANPLPAVDGYDVVLLGSGLWNVRPPMIMQSFAEGLDLRGRRSSPSSPTPSAWIGSAPDVYAEACAGATIGGGIAVRGEEVAQAGAQVTSWLDGVGLR
jgi:flavodoxin